jgi:hypothetical protein
MITLDLGKHRRARIWTEELPRIPIAIDQMVSLSIPVSRHSLALPKIAAVEVIVPLGARAMYGLLGGSITPAYSDLLRIDVALTDGNGELLLDTLAPPGEEVRAGLPHEFSGAVLDAIALAQQRMPDLPSGHLTIDCAAYAAVSSSSRMFQHLFHILLQVITYEEELTDEVLSRFFPEAYY